MKLMTRTIAAVSITLAASAGIALAWAQDDDDHHETHGGEAEQTVVIKFESAPQSVRDAFSELAPGKAPSRVERIADEDVTKFEIEYPGADGTCSATFSDHGHLLESEMAIQPSALPEAALRELMKDYPGAEILEAESVQLHFYEVEIIKDGKKHEVIVLATGDIEDQVFGGEDDEEHADDDNDDRHHQDDDDDDDDDDDE